MKFKPNCSVPRCDNKGLVFMNGKYYCGECVAKWNRLQEEIYHKQMVEVLKNEKSMSEV